MKRHSQRKFSREPIQRRAFVRSLLVALVNVGRIRTTEARAKTLKREADRLVTLGKRGTLHGRRQVIAKVGPAAGAKLVGEVAPKFASRAGGYTRVMKLGRRTSDGSPMALIEFVS